jgi:hypothetical protein
MHKNTTKCNKTLSKWCKNKHGASKIIDTFGTYQYPTVKITISGETFHARCDIMSEFCLMPKDVYESLSLWKLSEGGEEFSLTNNATIFLVGIAEGVYIKVLGKMVSTILLLNV